MKRNLRLAHAPHCYWHQHTFLLNQRAPVSTSVAQWEGMPETTTSDPSHIEDYKLQDQLRKDAAIRAREKRQEEIEERIREERRQKKREEKKREERMEEKSKEERRRKRREEKQREEKQREEERKIEAEVEIKVEPEGEERR
jgi:hypothetical protein